MLSCQVASASPGLASCSARAAAWVASGFKVTTMLRLSALPPQVGWLRYTDWVTESRTVANHTLMLSLTSSALGLVGGVVLPNSNSACEYCGSSTFFWRLEAG